MSTIQCHVDTYVGFTTGKVSLKRCENVGGTFYWKAIEPIDSIFGTDVDAEPLVGIGKTKEIALKRLEHSKRQFSESLLA